MDFECENVFSSNFFPFLIFLKVQKRPLPQTRIKAKPWGRVSCGFSMYINCNRVLKMWCCNWCIIIYYLTTLLCVSNPSTLPQWFIGELRFRGGEDPVCAWRQDSGDEIGLPHVDGKWSETKRWGNQMPQEELKKSPFVAQQEIGECFWRRYDVCLLSYYYPLQSNTFGGRTQRKLLGPWWKLLSNKGKVVKLLDFKFLVLPLW